MYGNQDEIGYALAKLTKEGVVKRKDIWITSKACTPCQHLSQAALRSLILTLCLGTICQACVGPVLLQATKP